MKFNLPVRFKILILIMTSLGASLVTYTYVGSQLIVEDKASYIYDYTLAEVKAATERIDNRLVQVSSFLKTLAQLTSTTGSQPANSVQFFEKQALQLGVQGVAAIRDNDNNSPLIFAKYGSSNDAGAEGEWLSRFKKPTTEGIISLGTARPLNTEKVLIPLSVEAIDPNGKKVWMMAEVLMPHSLLSDGSKNYELRLMNEDGKALILKNSDENPMSATSPSDEAKTQTFFQSVSKTTFQNGVRDFKMGDTEWIAAFQRLNTQGLLVTGMIPKDKAFSAARQLIGKSIALGISILFLATGITLVSVRSLTRQLKEMFEATRKVAEGDFSIRVDTSKSSNDEVGGLAVSFNSMAEKIAELIIHTADKARMEKELETAQEFQSRFFPPESYEGSGITISGSYVPASECAGDWWHYAQVGDHLIVIVGDVTGHGVASALVTAAAHSSFMLLIRQFREQSRTEIPIFELMAAMNSAIHAAGNGHSTMSMIACVIDLKTRVMQMINASHPPLYVLRPPRGDDAAEITIKNFKPLMKGRIPPLGETLSLELDLMEYTLEPGDRIFWYTDGVMETRISDGAKLSKTQYLKTLAQNSPMSKTHAQDIMAPALKEILDFYGEGSSNRPDDITFVVATIS